MSGFTPELGFPAGLPCPGVRGGRIGLCRNHAADIHVRVDNYKEQNGLAVTAEIVTGTRRVADYLLSPIARATNEAGRER